MRRDKKASLLCLMLLTVPMMAYQNCSLPLTNGFLTSNAADLSSTSTQAQAMAILTTKCASCHGGGSSQGGISNIDDPTALISQGLVIPGSPTAGSLVSVISDKSMPLSGSAVTSSELATIESWIASAASPGTTITATPTPAPSTPAPAVAATFSSIQSQILVSCTSCHSQGGSGLPTNLTSYAAVMGTGSVVAGDPISSSLYQEVANGNMPLYSQVLNSNQIEAIRQWILAGALNN